MKSREEIMIEIESRLWDLRTKGQDTDSGVLRFDELQRLKKFILQRKDTMKEAHNYSLREGKGL